jgi:hypothetical protein
MSSYLENEDLDQPSGYMACLDSFRIAAGWPLSQPGSECCGVLCSYGFCVGSRPTGS